MCGVVTAALGCAGGSSLVGIRFYGTVEENNQALSGALVTVVATNESAVVDSDGHFTIYSTTFDSIVEIQITNGSHITRLTIGIIPDTTEEVHLHIKAAEDSFFVAELTLYPEAQLEPLPTPTPTPIPTIGPNPTQTPKPESNFDSAGNTSAFGIPSGMRGNISAGKRVWGRVCSACHVSEKNGRRFNDIKRARRSQPEMRALSITDQQIADVVAYLNRGSR